jgi:hypothetical protein
MLTYKTAEVYNGEYDENVLYKWVWILNKAAVVYLQTLFWH